MTDVLIVGDTERCSELRHELPLRIGDPFIYAEIGDRRIAVVWSIEGDRIAVVDPTVEIVPVETISIDDLIAAGVDYYEVTPTQVVRAVQSLGIAKRACPSTRSRSVWRTSCAPRASSSCRTSDSSTCAAGGRRRPSSKAFAARPEPRRRRWLRSPRSSPGPSTATGGRVVDGEPLTSELLRDVAEAAFAEHGARSDDSIVAHGAQAADGHHVGAGRVANDDVLVCDLFPIDLESACYSDMTRTFSVGSRIPSSSPGTSTRERRSSSSARSSCRARTAPSCTARCAGFYEERGYRTRLSAEEGTVLREGFNHASDTASASRCTRRPPCRGAVR